MPDTFKAHFDGQTIRPDEPVDLAPGTPLLVTRVPRRKPEGKNRFSKFAGRISCAEADRMKELIEEEFERIEGDW